MRRKPDCGVGPEAMIGRVVLIGVAGSEAYEGAEGILIPPLNVEIWANEKMRYATLGDDKPKTFFFGRLRTHVRVLSDLPFKDEILRIRGVRFCSAYSDRQPHFYLDGGFRRRLGSHPADSLVPVSISGTVHDTNYSQEFVSDSDNFFPVGDGYLRLHVSGVGFLGDWMDGQPNVDELRKAEREALTEFEETHHESR